MNIKRISGIALVVVGVALFFLAGYIADQVEEGKGKVAKGQGQVDTIRDVSGSNRYTKDVGGIFADSGQKKIDAGKKEISKYETIVLELRIGGAILVAVGGFLIVYSIPRRRSGK